MIRGFADQGTEDVFNGSDTKAARRTCPSSLVKVARRKLDMVNAATVLGDLRIPPSNQLETLQPPRRGQHSIRVNNQYRIVFTWKPDGPRDVEMVDYH